MDKDIKAYAKPFCDCDLPIMGQKCLALEYSTFEKDGMEKPYIFRLASDEELDRYTLLTFGVVIRNIESFIKDMDKSQMEKILLRHHALIGKEAKATLHLYDVAEDCVHVLEDRASSKTIRFNSGNEERGPEQYELPFPSYWDKHFRDFLQPGNIASRHKPHQQGSSI